jgi:hypothetical protein
MKTRFVALAIAATLGLGSISAFAQDHDRDGRAQGQWQHQRADHDRRDWGRDHRYAAPGYYSPSYSYRNDGDVAGAVVLGALAGALMGQAATPYYSAPSYYNPPPVAYYNPPSTYYTPPPTTYYNPGYGYYGY